MYILGGWNPLGHCMHVCLAPVLCKFHIHRCRTECVVLETVVFLTVVAWFALKGTALSEDKSLSSSNQNSYFSIMHFFFLSSGSFFVTLSQKLMQDLCDFRFVAVQVWALTVEKWANSAGNNSEINELWLHGRCLTLRSILDLKDDFSICGCDRHQPHFTEPISPLISLVVLMH